MFSYTYKALTRDGRHVEGIRGGLSRWFVRRALSREGYVVVRIDPAHVAGAAGVTPFSMLVRMTSYEQILFFRNFAMMLESGVAISQSLETLAEQARGIGVRGVVSRMCEQVRGGAPLSSAMRKYPRLFPVHIQKMVEVGEHSGTLANTMDRISTDVEKGYELRRKVIGAVLYPIIILSFMVCTALLLVVFVIPQLTSMFKDMGVPVPPLTAFLERAGAFLLAYPIGISIVVAMTIAFFVFLMRLYTWRLIVHSLFLRVPIFGTLVREYNLVQLTHALTTLISSGVPFSKAVSICEGVLRNEAYRQSLREVEPIIVHGGKLSDALRRYPRLYPPQMIQMTLVGERSGRLGYALEKIGGHYRRSVEFQAQTLTTVIEPILMLIAGVTVGMLAYSMFGPLYQMTSLIE